MKSFIISFLLFFSSVFYPLLVSAQTCQQAKSMDNEVFKERREILMKQMRDFSIALIKGGDIVMDNHDDDIPFRQNNNFYYLTGFDNPKAFLILIKDRVSRSILFTDILPLGNQYDKGPHSVEEVMKATDIDEAYNISEFDKLFGEIVNYIQVQDEGNKKLTIYYNRLDKDLEKMILDLSKRDIGKDRQSNITAEISMLDSLPLIHSMRRIKSCAEIEMLETAICITGAAIHKTLQGLPSFFHEREIKATLGYEYALEGAVREGFASISASGPDTLIVHDTKFGRELREHDMVVLDIGADYNYYTADISRTVPKNGKFTQEQSDIYTAVLKVQEEIISRIKPGISGMGLHDQSIKLIAYELYQLKLITDEKSKWQYLLYYPHGIGHKLGMNVHDVGGWKNPDDTYATYQENMVVTVEPGIYVSLLVLEKAKEVLGYFKPFFDDDPTLKFEIPSDEELKTFKDTVHAAVEKYNEIGVRIEDDILVTNDGYRNLSGFIPKTIPDIEALMTGK